MTMAIALPAVKPVIAERHVPGTINAVTRSDTFFQRRQRDEQERGRVDTGGKPGPVGPREVEPAVALLLPTVELGIAQAHGAVAVVQGVRLEASFERRQGDDHLEGRAWRIGAGYGLVGQRRQRILDQRAPLVTAEAAIEGIGIEGG